MNTTETKQEEKKEWIEAELKEVTLEGGTQTSHTGETFYLVS